MKKILIPVDFSFYSQKALDFAVGCAKLFPAELHVLYIYDGGSSNPGDFLSLAKPVNTDFYEDLELKLSQLRKSILETEQIEIKTRVLTGSIEQLIVDYSSETGTDLVVMGTVGATGMKEKIWGSKTASVINRSIVPVIAIPWDYQQKKIQKILLATNVFQDENPARDLVIAVTTSLGASLCLAVFSGEKQAVAVDLLENERGIQSYRQHLAARYPDLSISAVHLSGPDFKETLQQYIQSENIDMLCMITGQKNFWERLFNPSLTRKLSFDSKVPLMAVPARFNNKD